MSTVFHAPEKQSDGTFQVKLKTLLMTNAMRWSTNHIVGDMNVQMSVSDIRNQVLNALVDNRALFKQAPTLDALRAITPVWGMLIRQGNTVEWSKTDVVEGIPNEIQGKEAQIRLELTSVRISRQSILPVWKMNVVEIFPDAGGEVIDLEFDDCPTKEEAVSVASDELATEDGVLELKDPMARKKQHKDYAREMLRKAAEAQLQADAAVERFYMEYDLSDDESNVSEEDEDEDSTDEEIGEKKYSLGR